MESRYEFETDLFSTHPFHLPNLIEQFTSVTKACNRVVDYNLELGPASAAIAL
jgi:hypothetical protein